jgi:hypothetical protein
VLHSFQCGSRSSSTSKRIQGFDRQKLKIFTWYSLKTFLFLDQIFLLSLGLYEGRPSYKRSLQPFKKNIQHLKTWNFFTSLYFCG